MHFLMESGCSGVLATPLVKRPFPGLEPDDESLEEIPVLDQPPVTIITPKIDQVCGRLFKYDITATSILRTTHPLQNPHPELTAPSTTNPNTCMSPGTSDHRVNEWGKNHTAIRITSPKVGGAFYTEHS